MSGPLRFTSSPSNTAPALIERRARRSGPVAFDRMTWIAQAGAGAEATAGAAAGHNERRQAQQGEANADCEKFQHRLSFPALRRKSAVVVPQRRIDLSRCEGLWHKARAV